MSDISNNPLGDLKHSAANLLPTITGLMPGNHLCCLYKTEEEHRAVLAPFIRKGLELGERVIYTADTHTAEAILNYAQDTGLDFVPYLQKEQLVLLSSNDVYLRGGVFDPDRMIAMLESETERALAEGYTALRVTGEMSWALKGLHGSERLIEYEAKLNDFFPRNKCLAICQYDMRQFNSTVALDVLRTHPIAIVGKEVYQNFYYIPPAEFLGPDLPSALLSNCLTNLDMQKQREEEIISLARFPAENPNPVLRLSKEGLILYYNTASTCLLKAWEYMEGQPIWDQWYKIVQNVLDSGLYKEIEVTIADQVFSLIFAPVVELNYVNVYGHEITERKKVEEELKSSREKLRCLAVHLQSAREEERTSIAREIHDELGQALTALKMDLFWLKKRSPEDQRPYLEKLLSMVRFTDKTIQTVKRISTDLRPGLLDDLGLIAAIEWQAEEFQERTGIKCSVAIDIEDIRLDEGLRTAIFRIFQETLTNIARHADATRVRIYLRKRAKSLELEVRDNGKGITAEQISDPKAFGLLGMRERVQIMEGEVRISGTTNKGTKVLVKIPFHNLGQGE